MKIVRKILVFYFFLAIAVMFGPSHSVLAAKSMSASDVAFFPSISNGTISALDLQKNKIAWTLKVSKGTEKRGPESAMGIAATRNGKWIFTGDVAKNEVIIVNSEKQSVVKRISVAHRVHAIDLSPDGQSVWVAGKTKEYEWLSGITKIDVKTQKVKFHLNPGLGDAAHFAFTPDGKEIWAASISTNLAWVMSAQDGKVLDVVPLVSGNVRGESPESKLGLIGFNEVAIAPDGKRAFFVGPEAGVVFAVDVKRRKVLGRLKVGDRAHGIAVSRDGKEVWTANNKGTIHIIDVASLKLKDRIDMSEHASEMMFAHVAFSLDGSRAYVAWSKDITVIDKKTRKIIAIVPVSAGPHEISLEDLYTSHGSNGDTKTSDHFTFSLFRTAYAAESRQAPKALSGKNVSQLSGITVTANLESLPTKGQVKNIELNLSLDTHSGDLMTFNLESNIEIQINGSKKTASLKWAPKTESSHHRQGRLVAKLNKPISEVESLDLVIHGLRGGTRTFTWTTQNADKPDARDSD